MVLDERFDVWTHYEVYSNSEAVLLAADGAEIARFDFFESDAIAAALP